MHFDLEIDAIGLKCPMPILKCKKGLNSIQVTQILKISTTDINAKKDLEFFCRQTGGSLMLKVIGELDYRCWKGFDLRIIIIEDIGD
jgi:tRNA 2-thiouridine synthesizing protein A